MDRHTSTVFVFTVKTPAGQLSTALPLVPGRVYSPEDVRVQQGPLHVDGAYAFTLQATRLPGEAHFRMMAARAVTRAADDTSDPTRRLLNLLIPF